jgi:hypothetical protein
VLRKLFVFKGHCYGHVFRMRSYIDSHKTPGSLQKNPRGCECRLAHGSTHECPAAGESWSSRLSYPEAHASDA